MANIVDLQIIIEQILDPIEYDVFKRYFVMGEKQREIARIYGVSQQTISRWLEKIRDKINKDLR